MSRAGAGDVEAAAKAPTTKAGNMRVRRRVTWFLHRLRRGEGSPDILPLPSLRRICCSNVVPTCGSSLAMWQDRMPYLGTSNTGCSTRSDFTTAPGWSEKWLERSRRELLGH